MYRFDLSIASSVIKSNSLQRAELDSMLAFYTKMARERRYDDI